MLTLADPYIILKVKKKKYIYIYLILTCFYKWKNV